MRPEKARGHRKTGLIWPRVYLPGGGEGGGRLGLNHARMCVQKCGKWVLFWLQVNEMNEKMPFEMGAKFAALFYTRKHFFDVRHVFVCLSTRSELQSMEDKLNQ